MSEKWPKLEIQLENWYVKIISFSVWITEPVVQYTALVIVREQPFLASYLAARPTKF